MIQRKYFNDLSDKEKIFFVFIGVAVFSFMTFVNASFCLLLINNLSKVIEALFHVYQAEPALFNNNFYLFYVYFSLLTYIVLPILVITSLIFSPFYLIKKKTNKALLVVFIPVLFLIMMNIVGKGFLLFI